MCLKDIRICTGSCMWLLVSQVACQYMDVKGIRSEQILTLHLVWDWFSLVADVYTELVRLKLSDFFSSVLFPHRKHWGYHHALFIIASLWHLSHRTLKLTLLQNSDHQARRAKMLYPLPLLSKKHPTRILP